MVFVFKKQLKFLLFLSLLAAGFCVSSNSAQAWTADNTGTATFDVDESPYGFYGNINWSETLPLNTYLKTEVRAGDSTDTEDGSWSAWQEVENGDSLYFLNGHNYYQYQITLGWDDAAEEAPSVQDVSVEEGTSALNSSLYDTQNRENTLNGISWKENSTLPDNSAVGLYLKTAPDEDSLSSSSWQSIASSSPNSLTSGCHKDSGTGEVTCDSSVIPEEMKDGAEDRWMQYKLVVMAQDSSPATVSRLKVDYSMKDPQFNQNFGNQGVQAQRESDTEHSNFGQVRVDYSFKDADTTEEENFPNYVTPSFEYSLDGGSSWNNINKDHISFASAPEDGEVTDANGDGQIDHKALETEYLQYTAYWDARAQIPDEDTSDAQVRVTIDDHEDTDNTDQAQSADFHLNSYAVSDTSHADNTGTATFDVDESPYGFYGNINWSETLPLNTYLKTEVRAGDSTDTEDGSWSAWQEVENGDSLYFLNGHNYYQYQITLGWDDAAEEAPSVQDVSVETSGAEYLESSPYNSSFDSNTLTGLSWKEDPLLPSESRTTVYLRSASDEASLSSSSWQEIASSTTRSLTSGCRKDSDTGEVTCDSSVIPEEMKDGEGDQWFQYKVELLAGENQKITLEKLQVHYSTQDPQLNPDFGN
ncbi:MAG: hypothetical protein ACOCUF_02125, partial [Patescibacteria group bacterium]